MTASKEKQIRRLKREKKKLTDKLEFTTKLLNQLIDDSRQVEQLNIVYEAALQKLQKELGEERFKGILNKKEDNNDTNDQQD